MLENLKSSLFPESEDRDKDFRILIMSILTGVIIGHCISALIVIFGMIKMASIPVPAKAEVYHMTEGTRGDLIATIDGEVVVSISEYLNRIEFDLCGIRTGKMEPEYVVTFKDASDKEIAVLRYDRNVSEINLENVGYIKDERVAAVINLMLDYPELFDDSISDGTQADAR